MLEYPRVFVNTPSLGGKGRGKDVRGEKEGKRGEKVSELFIDSSDCLPSLAVQR